MNPIEAKEMKVSTDNKSIHPMRRAIQEALDAVQEAHRARTEMQKEALRMSGQVIDLQAHLEEERAQNGRLEQQMGRLQETLGNLQREKESVSASHQLQEERIEVLEQQNQATEERVRHLRQLLHISLRVERLVQGQMLQLRSQLVAEQEARRALQSAVQEERERQRQYVEEVQRRAQEAANLQVHRERELDALNGELEELRDRYQAASALLLGQAGAIFWGSVLTLGPLGWVVGPVAGLGYLITRSSEETLEMQQWRERAQEIIAQIGELHRLLGRPWIQPELLDIDQPAQKHRRDDHL